MTFPRRPWPNRTLEELRPPKDGFPYFAHADAMPFEPDAPAVSLVNAWWLADASMLAYGDRAFVDAAFAASPLPELGYRAEWAGGQHDQHVLVLNGPGVTIVAPRGTRLNVHEPLARVRLVVPSLQDLLTDAQVKLVPLGAGKVHSGFRSAFENVRESLGLACERATAAGRRLWLTGHSLGGAISTLMAVELGRERVAGVYTFGCPPVGDAAFAQSLAAWPLVRFVHGADWAGRDPPASLRYVHAGERREVLGDVDEPAEESVGDRVRRGLDALRRIGEHGLLDTGKLPVPARALSDHAPVCYATGVWNMLPGVG